MRKIIIVSVLGSLLFVGVLFAIFNPRIQIEFYVRENAHNPDGKPVHVAGWFIAPYFRQGAKPISSSIMNALYGMLSDPDTKVRKEALGLLMVASIQPENEAKIFAIPGIQEKLKILVDDPDTDIAQNSLCLLGRMGNKDNVPFFRKVLKDHLSSEDLCTAAIRALDYTNDPRTLDDILPLVHDNRNYVANEAINGISGYEDQRVLDVIAVMLPSTSCCSTSTSAMEHFHAMFPKHDISIQMDPALLAASRNNAIGTYTRLRLPELISDTQKRIQAWESILLSPSADHYAECQIDAADALGKMKSTASSASPSLEKALHDPATDSGTRAEVEKTLQEIRP